MEQKQLREILAAVYAMEDTVKYLSRKSHVRNIVEEEGKKIKQLIKDKLGNV